MEIPQPIGLVPDLVAGILMAVLITIVSAVIIVCILHAINPNPNYAWGFIAIVIGLLAGGAIAEFSPVNNYPCIGTTCSAQITEVGHWSGDHGAIYQNYSFAYANSVQWVVFTCNYYQNNDTIQFSMGMDGTDVVQSSLVIVNSTLSQPLPLWNSIYVNNLPSGCGTT